MSNIRCPHCGADAGYTVQLLAAFKWSGDPDVHGFSEDALAGCEFPLENAAVADCVRCDTSYTVGYLMSTYLQCVIDNHGLRAVLRAASAIAMNASKMRDKDKHLRIHNTLMELLEVFDD